MVFVDGVRLCRFGRVQIQICRPFGEKYKPFPTSFWLTCPYLVKLAGKIESSGGVRELENYITSHNLVHEWRKYNLEHQALRLRLNGSKMNEFLRRYRAGIFRDVMRAGTGGILVGEDVSVKCLHLQAASLLGTGHHPAAQWLKAAGLFGDCNASFVSRCTSCRFRVSGRPRTGSLPRKLPAL